MSILMRIGGGRGGGGGRGWGGWGLGELELDENLVYSEAVPTNPTITIKDITTLAIIFILKHYSIFSGRKRSE